MSPEFVEIYPTIKERIAACTHELVCNDGVRLTNWLTGWLLGPHPFYSGCQLFMSWEGDVLTAHSSDNIREIQKQ